MTRPGIGLVLVFVLGLGGPTQFAEHLIYQALVVALQFAALVVAI